MNITKENISDLNVLVKINLESDDYMPQVESSIKDFSKKANIKGFRKGKVPAGVIKKMYGREILAEELNKMISENLTNYLRENEIQILGDPLPAEGNKMSLDINEPGEQEFTFELGLQPEFTIPAVENKEEIVKYNIEIDDKIVDEEVVRLRKRYGNTTNPDAVEVGDVLYVQLEELDEQGEVKENGVENSPAIPLDMFREEKRAELMKMKKEDTMVVNVFEIVDKERYETAKFLLNLKPEELEGINEKFRMTLKNINRMEKAELNQEFFDKIYGQGTLNTEEEFRNKIREELKSVLQVNADRKLNNDIAKKLIEETPVTLPDDFLKRWLIESNKGEISKEQVEEEYEPFISNLKWSLIVNKILKDAEINVEQEEVESRTKELIKMEYGLTGEDESSQAYLSEFANHLMKNEEHVKKVYENVRDQKIFDHLKGQMTVKEENISYSDFKELK